MVQRFKEGSTWAGFAAMLQVAGSFFPTYAPVFHILTVAAGSVAAAIPDGVSK